MALSKKYSLTLCGQSSPCLLVHTTLYDLVEVVGDSVGPDEEGLIGTVVMQLLEDYSVGNAANGRNGSAKSQGAAHHT